MKDEKKHIWRCPKVFSAFVIALSAGCLGCLGLSVLIMVIVA